MNGIFATIKISAQGKLNGGIFAIFAAYLLKIVYLAPMLLIWKTFAESGLDLGGFTVDTLLTYTCVSAMLGQLLNIQTGAVTWHYDGGIIDLYRRPQTIFGQLITKTVGGLLPELIFFSLPIAAIMRFFGVNTIPATPLFFPCLLLSVSLGFAVDFLFTCFIIRLQNGAWMACSIRAAVTSLLSGAVIPFALLPFNLGGVFALLPFGSLAAAPLAVFAGAAEPLSVLPLQVFWNLILWPSAFWAFAKSREKMVSYGG